MIHLTPQQFSSYMDGELNEVSTELVRRHMGACEECTLKFAALEEQEEHLSHALVHEPGDEFFERFAAAVERQLPQGKESASKRGATSPASRAAALREAARTAGASPALTAAESRVEAPEVSKPEPERKPTPPRIAAPRPAAAEPSPAEGLGFDDVGFDDDAGFDDDVVTAARSADVPERERPPAPRHSPIEAPVPAARKPLERKATPTARPVQRPAPQRRPKIRRPAPSIPWYAAAILALIAGAAGVMVSRTNPVSAWLDSHGVKNQVPSQQSPTAVGSVPAPPTDQEPPARPAQEPAPGEKAPSVQAAPSDDEAPPPDDETSADDFPEPEPQAAEGFLTPSRDPFAGLPPAALGQVRLAQRRKDAADANPSTARYEAAAAEWERTIPLLGSVKQQGLGRLEIASSRYRAWESAPDESRAAAAAFAIRTYLSLAPQGAPRDVAKSWLARVSR